MSDAAYTQAVDPTTIGLTPLQSSITNDGSGPRFSMQLSILEPMPVGVILEIQSSTDLGVGDPWQTLASKTGPAAWTGPARVSVSPPANGSVTVTVTQFPASLPQRFFRVSLSVP